MTSSSHHGTSTGTRWSATTTAGRVTVALAGAFGVLFVWVMGLAALVDWVAPGVGATGWLDSWVTPVVMAVLVDAAAVAGLVAWRGGERGVIPQVLTWVCLATGVMWTFIVVGEVLGGA
ncbi:MAG TPA: hypothetical protein VFL46_00730 [Phycicoccus sp.]|nr:hypothetical protein [Phycicoccus sp.]